MQTEVKLQPDFSYPWIWIILVLLIFGGMLFLILHKKKEKVMTEAVNNNPQKNKYQIQQDYLTKVQMLRHQYLNENMSKRQAFYQISELVRSFAYEMTGVLVQNYSLSEIEKMGIPQLTRLINECYVPEFDEVESGDVLATIERTKEVIGTWNLNPQLY